MDHYERYLLALHNELSGQGVLSVLHTQGIRPRLRIYGTEDLPGCGFDSNVIAAALAGQWMFWWPWAEPIGPASQLTHTAAAIIGVLGLTAQDPAPGVQAALPPGVPSLAAQRRCRRARAAIPGPRRPASSSAPHSPDGMDPAS
jgi:4-amino-4-deoxy-L-arabinose transferase-like glycosyltransferase